ncbi:bacteriocin-associated integral membrane protein [Lactococcus lactis subsp. lactis]|nr:bacteriocin-associated integral membrane protein [Lactococcus lactis subsp. lactis]
MLLLIHWHFFKGSTIKYYFIKDAQKLDLLDENSTKISPDLVEVYTRKNFTDKGNITFQHNTVLKFKIRGTIEKTISTSYSYFEEK